MINSRMLLIFLLCIANTAVAQREKSSNPLLQHSLKKDSIQSEFTELYHLVNTIHPGQYQFSSKKEFDKTYNSLLKTITTDLSPIEYYKLTATLLANIKDGHTTTDRTAITSQLGDRLLFPFSIYQINNTYYLNKSTSENSSLTGLRLLKINGKRISSIAKEIRHYIHLEGQNQSGINVKFRNFPFYYFVFNPTEDFEIEYLDAQNNPQKTNIKGITYASFNKSTYQNIEPLTTEIRESTVGILKFHSFANGYNEKDRKKAEKQLDEFFATLDQQNIKNLIIDLRDNGGGAAEIANYLFSYLASEPYDYLDYVGAKYTSVKDWKHYAQNPNAIEDIDLSETHAMHGLNCYTDGFWWFEKQANQPNYYKGNLSVLIDGGCFSTTGHFLALLRNHHIGTFYGEYSQGSHYSNAGGQAFRLPYSKALFWIPTLQYKMKTPHFSYDPKGIQPDIEIPIQASDLRTNEDRIMDLVLQKIKTDTTTAAHSSTNHRR